MPNGGTVIVSATNTGTTADVWPYWQESSTATITSTGASQIIWIRWNSADNVTCGASTNDSLIIDGGTGSTVTWTHWVRAQEQSAEQVQRELLRQEEWRAQRLKLEAEEAEAKKRAEKLLTEHLSPPQREQLAAKGHFELDVISRNGERRRYQIRRGWSGNVKQVCPSSGRILRSLCIHPRETVPVADNMLAQKLLLEANEEEFLRVANHS